MVVGWYHSHPGFGCWLSGVDVNTQQSFEQLNGRAVAVVVDPIQVRERAHSEVDYDGVSVGVVEGVWLPRTPHATLASLVTPSPHCSPSRARW